MTDTIGPVPASPAPAVRRGKRSAARRSHQPSSMTHRASRSRPVGVRGALRWTTRASLARGADVAIHTEPGGPHPFKIIRSVSPTYLTSVVSTARARLQRPQSYLAVPSVVALLL